MARCYVCNASPNDDCQAIDGEIAECPRPSNRAVVIRHCEGGETVTNGTAKTACNYCSGGVCRQMQACEQPSA